MRHLAKNRHFFNEIVAQVELLQLRQLQVDRSDVVVAGDDVLEPLERVQDVDVVQVVLGDVNLLQVLKRCHFLQICQVLQPHAAELENARVLLQTLLNLLLDLGLSVFNRVVVAGTLRPNHLPVEVLGALRVALGRTNVFLRVFTGRVGVEIRPV